MSLRTPAASVLSIVKKNVSVSGKIIIRAHKIFTMSKNTSSSIDESSIASKMKQLAPPLAEDKHKGQAGRVGVFGGSLEYTGAPYFAAIAALKVGADLVHVFCAQEAGVVIKSYSPELIVHPILDDEKAMEKITPWLERLHVIVIGPGLGREPKVFNVITSLIGVCRELAKPLVIDADGLLLVAQNPDVIKNYPPPGVILTPNIMEFSRLADKAQNISGTNNLGFGNNVTILRKGMTDEIMDSTKKLMVTSVGTGRRCGGQGDLLCGSLGTFYTWALLQKAPGGSEHDDRAMIACYAACQLTRQCNVKAFKLKGRSMICSDMIEMIHPVFAEKFELSG